MKKKKTKKNIDPFKELVLALEKKTQYSDSMGKGLVKGNDVARMRDYINQGKSKNA